MNRAVFDPLGAAPSLRASLREGIELDRYRSKPRPRSASDTVAFVVVAAFTALGVLWVGAVLLEMATGSDPSIVALLMSVGWTVGWARLWLRRNKPGYRASDFWVEVSGDGVRVSTWIDGWKGRTQVLRDLQFHALKSVVVEDSIDRTHAVTLLTRDGADCGISDGCLQSASEIRAFCQAIRRYRPDLPIVDRKRILDG